MTMLDSAFPEQSKGADGIRPPQFRAPPFTRTRLFLRLECLFSSTFSLSFVYFRYLTFPVHVAECFYGRDFLQATSEKLGCLLYDVGLGKGLTDTEHVCCYIKSRCY